MTQSQARNQQRRIRHLDGNRPAGRKPLTMGGWEESLSHRLEQVDSRLGVREYKLSRVTRPGLQRSTPPATRLRHRVQPDECSRNRAARRIFEHDTLDRPGLDGNNESQRGNNDTHTEPGNSMTPEPPNPWMLCQVHLSGDLSTSHPAWGPRRPQSPPSQCGHGLPWRRFHPVSG